MKRLFLLLYALLFVVGLSAQTRVGIMGGLNLTDVVFDRSFYDVAEREGFFIGPTVLINMPVKGLELNGSLLFEQRGMRTSTQLDGGPSFPTTSTLQQLAIPLNVRYYIDLGEKIKAFVFAGPQVGFNIGKKEVELDYGEVVFDKASFSINAGIGLLAFRHFMLSVNYNYVCGNTGEIWINRSLDIGKQVNDFRFNAWQLSLGYYF